MPTITSANAVLTLSVSTIFTAPFQLQGFSADDIYTTGPLASAETLMGLDGKLSGGYVHVPVTWNIALQADSTSNDLFDQWFQLQQTNSEVYEASGILLLPSISKKWVLTTGFLTSFPPFPDAAKTLRPRRYGMLWQSVSSAPI
jgi:hypothetical protein